MDNPHSNPTNTSLTEDEIAQRTVDENPEKLLELYESGNTFADQFRHSGEVKDIDKAISAFEEAARLTPNSHPVKPTFLHEVGVSYTSRFDHLGDTADIHKAISFHEMAVQLTPDDQPNKVVCLVNLGNAYNSRFRHLRDVADLDSAISAQKSALQLTPDGHANMYACLSNIGNSYFRRFEQLGEVADIEMAIIAHNKAVQITTGDHPKEAICLTNLGNSYHSQFKHLGNVLDLVKAISAHEDALQLTPDGHLNRPGRLNNLGVAKQSQFKHHGDISDLDKAILVHSSAAQLTPDGHPDKTAYLDNLARSYHWRFQQLGDLTDLSQAISAQKKAVQFTGDNHPDKPGYLNNLGASLRAQFEHKGDIANLEEAISAYNKAMELSPDSHPDKPSHLNNLGLSLRAQFQHLGDIVNLDKTISVQNRAVKLSPDSHPEKPTYLNNIGNSYYRRFERLGDISDLKNATSAQEKAVQLILDDDPNKPNCLNNLGVSFQTQFECWGDSVDLGKAISAMKKAIELTSDSYPNKPKFLSNLGNSYHNQFEHLKDPADLQKAISAKERAVQLTPDGHPNKPGCWSNLGISIQTQFECSGDVADLSRAISIKDKAVQLTPDGHPDKGDYMSNLGNSYYSKFENLRDNTDLHKSIYYFSHVACSSTDSPHTRLKAAQRWAICASEISPSSSLIAYECILNLLPHVAWLGLHMVDQHRELTNIGDVVCKAAAVAIACNKFSTALEWLEQGRSIVWGQLLHLRTPVDELSDMDPTLASELKKVSIQLEHVSTRDIHVSLDSKDQWSLEEASQNHRQLALKWDKLLNSARAIPGFEDFLQPKKLVKLRSAARSGPVIVINVHEDRCDALVLLNDQDNLDTDAVMHIPLPEFSYSQAQALSKSLVSHPSICTRSMRHIIDEEIPIDEVDDTFQWLLSELWLKIVKPVLDDLAFSVLSSSSTQLPRIWWCATGPLAFLPLHAAGLYENNNVGDNIMDFVTSSYTPTLTALLGTPPSTPKDKFQLLTVTQPATPEASLLPGVKEELRYIQQHAGTLSIRSLEGNMATKEHVLAGMKDCSWIHLACHGIQNATDPTSSALLLQDGRLKLSEIIQMNLPDAEFAFLSACQTATGDQNLSEEAVHLAAGMLLAGYHGVIATMWSIKDNDAPVIADKVYAQLFEKLLPNSTQAAHALHLAVQHLRTKGVPFVSWVPFIHVGM